MGRKIVNGKIVCTNGARRTRGKGGKIICKGGRK